MERSSCHRVAVKLLSKTYFIIQDFKNTLFIIVINNYFLKLNYNFTIN